MPTVRMKNYEWNRAVEDVETGIKRWKMKWNDKAREFLKLANPNNIELEHFSTFDARQIIVSLKYSRSDAIRAKDKGSKQKQELEDLIKKLDELESELLHIRHEIKQREAIIELFKAAGDKKNSIWDSGIGEEATSSDDDPTGSKEYLKEKLMEQMD